jgi:hypothetical protein
MRGVAGKETGINPEIVWSGTAVAGVIPPGTVIDRTVPEPVVVAVALAAERGNPERTHLDNQ